MTNVPDREPEQQGATAEGGERDPKWSELTEVQREQVLLDLPDPPATPAPETCEGWPKGEPCAHIDIAFTGLGDDIKGPCRDCGKEMVVLSADRLAALEGLETDRRGRGDDDET